MMAAIPGSICEVLDGGLIRDLPFVRVSKVESLGALEIGSRRIDGRDIEA